ncbi:hypothetical protein AB1N83_008027 [Pleurotus pulmonarius]
MFQANSTLVQMWQSDENPDWAPHPWRRNSSNDCSGSAVVCQGSTVLGSLDDTQSIETSISQNQHLKAQLFYDFDAGLDATRGSVAASMVPLFLTISVGLTVLMRTVLKSSFGIVV